MANEGGEARVRGIHEGGALTVQVTLFVGVLRCQQRVARQLRFAREVFAIACLEIQCHLGFREREDCTA